jgi:serine/threonine-protein kinase
MAPKAGDGPCLNCGYDDSQAQDSAYLPVRTVIAERYAVGRILSTNGESITYLGLDCETGTTVQIREYMPAVLCGRRLDGSIAINAGCETHYKTLMLEYEEILKTLRQLGNVSGVVPVMDICRQNNTVYGIFQNIRTISLGKFLTKCGGDLNWSRAKKIFLPLLHTISTLHGAGLIHRGISPETVQIDRSGNLWLTEFSTAALRTNQSEIEPELSTGYAAPEQYNPQSPQGPWTDVYSAAALLYKTLTGTMPPQSTSRRINDNLCPCAELNDSIPANVSDAVSAAMNIDTQERLQSAEEFISDLLQAAGGKTSIYQAKRPEKAPAVKEPVSDEPVRTAPRRRHHRSYGAVYAVLAMVLTFALLGTAVWRLMGSLLETPEIPDDPGSSQSSNAGFIGPAFLEDTNVPNFVGMSREEIQAIHSAYVSTLNECAQIFVSEVASELGISRNSPCMCGSGKKFKRCCSRATMDEIANRWSDLPKR